MKRIRCPKCDEPILFDDSLYTPGRTLIFECPDCRKQFKIRVGGKSVPLPNIATTEEERLEEEEEKQILAHLVVIENAFHFKQIIPLFEGDNRIGRYEKGTNANAAIKTVDPSVDNTHCVINIRVNRYGNTKYVLRDGPSGTGTFLMNELVGVKERVNIEDGAIITLGATTMIFREGQPEDEEAV